MISTNQTKLLLAQTVQRNKDRDISNLEDFNAFIDDFVKVLENICQLYGLNNTFSLLPDFNNQVVYGLIQTNNAIFFKLSKGEQRCFDISFRSNDFDVIEIAAQDIQLNQKLIDKLANEQNIDGVINRFYTLYKTHKNSVFYIKCKFL